MPMLKTTILIAGCGSIGARHARNLHELGATDLLLFDPDKERTEALGRELSAQSFADIERAFERQPELALICAPTSLHLPLARLALERDCHLFVEKPLSDSMKGAAELIDTAKLRDRVLFAGYNFRFDEVIRQVRRWVSEEKVGQVTSARFHFGSYLPWRHPWEDYRNGYGARSELGGGVILDAVHELDMAVWFFGLPERVHCVGGKYSDLQMDAEDTAEMTLSYRDKVVSVHVDYVRRPAERWCEIIGTRGQIHADVFGRWAECFDGETRTWTHANAYTTLDESYKAEMRHLIDCVGGRAEPFADGQIALQSLALAVAAKESMRSGQAVACGSAFAMKAAAQ